MSSAAKIAPAAASAARAPVGGVPLVDGARVPLAFIGLGLAALVTATAWLALSPAALQLPYVHPTIAALAHLWLPGFLLSVCLGAVYQLMPVVLGAPLRLPLAAVWTHFVLHGSGVTLLVAGFGVGRFPIVALGGAILTLGIVLFVIAVLRTFASATRRDAVGWSFPLAALWLGGTVAAGVLLAVNRHAPFLPFAITDLLHAHAHLGLVGFFLTLLQGATFQLVPMFTLSELRDSRLVAVGLGCSQIGLLLLIVGLPARQTALTLAGALALGAALACSGTALARTWRRRRRRNLEPGLHAFAFGTALLVPAAALGLVRLLGKLEDPNFAAVYGLVAIGGALSLMVLGMLCKIVPFLTWMRSYGPRAGRQPVPLATSLGSKRLESAWLGLHGAAIAGLTAGVALGSTPLTRAGCALLAGAVLAFVSDMLCVVRHLFRPDAPTAVPLPATARLS